MKKRCCILALVFLGTVGIVAGITRNIVYTVFLGILYACCTAIVASMVMFVSDQIKEGRQENVNGGGI